MTRLVIIVYAPPGACASSGKFLQLAWQGQEYLLFASTSLHRYHNQILARFLNENALPHHWIGEEHLQVEAPGLSIGGGGRFRIDENQGTLALWDDSHAYGRFQAEGLAARIADAEHPWHRLRVEVS